MGMIEKVMPNCKKATYLIEKQQFSVLSLREQIKLQIHLASCSWCRIYEKQSKNIQLLMANVCKQSAQEVKELDPKFKDDLNILIAKKLKNE